MNFKARNPADLWGGPPAAIQKPTGGRIVRLLGKPYEGEEDMPKGQYQRKPRAEAPAANDATPTPQKRVRKARALAVTPKGKPNGSGDTGRFDVSLDLRGGAVTINAHAGSLTLAPDEVLSLFAFIGRR